MYFWHLTAYNFQVPPLPLPLCPHLSKLIRKLTFSPAFALVEKSNHVSPHTHPLTMIRVKPISFPCLAISSWFRLRVCPVLLWEPHYLSNKFFIPSWCMNDIASNNKPNFVFMKGLPKQM